MPIIRSEIVMWAGTICWIISASIVAFVGVKYQIKHGLIGSCGIEFNRREKKLLKSALMILVSGTILFIIGIR